MPRTHAKRKHENQTESPHQQNQRSHARNAPEHGNRQILQKELAQNAAAHRKRIVRNTLHAKILERQEERQINSQQAQSNRKTQELSP